MAFTADIITDKLRTMKNAYISAIVRYSDKSKTCIQLNVWETAEARQEFPYIPAFVPPELELPTDLLSLIHISEPTRPCGTSRMPSSA